LQFFGNARGRSSEVPEACAFDADVMLMPPALAARQDDAEDAADVPTPVTVLLWLIDALDLLDGDDTNSVGVGVHGDGASHEKLLESCQDSLRRELVMDRPVLPREQNMLEAAEARRDDSGGLEERGEHDQCLARKDDALELCRCECELSARPWRLVDE